MFENMLRSRNSFFLVLWFYGYKNKMWISLWISVDNALLNDNDYQLGLSEAKWHGK